MISLLDDASILTEVGTSFFAAVDNAMEQGKGARVAIDCEGVDLSRRGTLELICLKFEDAPSHFVVDLQGATEAVEERVNAIKRLFENGQVTKIIHDCRMDCDALMGHRNIKLINVHDTSIFHELLTGHECIGLNNLLAYHSMHLNLEKDNYVYRDNHRFWETRPLTKSMKERAVGDIAALLEVSEKQIEQCTMRNILQEAMDKSTQNSTKATDMSMEEVLCKVPIGRFIGTKGANIQSLRRRTGTLLYSRGGSRDTFFVYYPNQASLVTVKRSMGHYI